MQAEGTYLSLLGELGNKIARVVKAQSFVRLVGTPFQKLIDKSGKTHRFLTELAVKVLRNDGHEEAASFMKRSLERIIKGNYWADTLWMNSTHHYSPRTRHGLWIWPAATEQIKNWFQQASALWAKDKEKALFMLGACLHIVQDTCQPYHSNCVVLRGHQEYERWVDKNKERFAVEDGGIYGLSETPEGWVIANAEFSMPYLDAVCGSSEEARKEATAVLIPRAIRTTAGFMLFFLEHVAGKALDHCPQA